MFLSITLAALFIIAMVIYAAVAIRDIWKEQAEAEATVYALALPVLRDTRDKMKAANDQTEANIREYFAEKGIPFNENYNAL